MVINTATIRRKFITQDVTITEVACMTGRRLDTPGNSSSSENEGKLVKITFKPGGILHMLKSDLFDNEYIFFWFIHSLLYYQTKTLHV